MKVMPSIDISNRRSVKRIKGKRNSGIVLGDPIYIAYEIYSYGYDCIHIVDLDAAEGIDSNEDIIKNIASIGFKWIQIGGGIRDVEKASRILSYGASAIIVSTLFFSNSIKFNEIYRNIGGDKILISIDYDDKYNVMIKGWKERGLDINKAIELLKKTPVLGVIFTYISSEGTCKGIDKNIVSYISIIDGLKEYAGGVSNYDDLLFLKNAGFDYVVIGMALYKGYLKGVKIV